MPRVPIVPESTGHHRDQSQEHWNREDERNYGNYQISASVSCSVIILVVEFFPGQLGDGFFHVQAVAVMRDGWVRAVLR